MAEFTYRVEASELADPRLHDLGDLLDELIADGRILGPALAADLDAGLIDLIVTVEAPSEPEGAAVAGRAFARALVATGRAPSVASVAPEPVEA